MIHGRKRESKTNYNPQRKDDYIFKAKKELEQQERFLNEDFKRGIVDFDNHWDSEHIRKTLENTNT
ncbi:hypothetical protein HSX10_16595 [Winogradskyella undariae]|uniref:hypothetical protein n=1 Tax=Winogradskyella undariae TaxID=1285465 RepID=UPI00156B0C0B|nr:hypothetical protein [Winogradskyella undariae]NRR93197.1 hypothetical protein [Winogradskyella undariae]